MNAASLTEIQSKVTAWHDSWSFLTAPGARPFLLLSCLAHAVLLGLAWQFNGLPVPQNGSNPALKIILNSGPDSPPLPAPRDNNTSVASVNPQSVKRPQISSQAVATAPHLPYSKKITGNPATYSISQSLGEQSDRKPKPLKYNAAANSSTTTVPSAPAPQAGLNAGANPTTRAAHAADRNASGRSSHLQKQTTSMESAHTLATTASTMSSPPLSLMITTQIKQALKHHLHYPYIARQRGWNGQVMLGFQVNRDGSLTNIHLSESSGYSILDNSALSAMHKIKRLPQMEQKLPAKTDTIHIPVLFRFTQG